MLNEKWVEIGRAGLEVGVFNLQTTDPAPAVYSMEFLTYFFSTAMVRS